MLLYCTFESNRTKDKEFNFYFKGIVKNYNRYLIEVFLAIKIIMTLIVMKVNYSNVCSIVNHRSLLVYLKMNSAYSFISRGVLCCHSSLLLLLIFIANTMSVIVCSKYVTCVNMTTEILDL